ncbi:MAG: hypothetical protein KC543_05545, partial [Myxococcales bacterium]|nr:hypothetical protein [Myxococcales bacterium]
SAAPTADRVRDHVGSGDHAAAAPHEAPPPTLRRAPDGITVPASLAAAASGAAAEVTHRHAPPRPPAAVRPGTIRISVVPWGKVWLDGRYLGRAPLRRSVSPGRHVIGAGRASTPTVERIVHVARGRARSIEIELP